MSPSCDILIIGGGIVGLAIARSLRRQGQRVTVIERGIPGQEASWAAAGMLVPHCEFDKPDPFSDACDTSLSRYPEFVEALQAESDQAIDYRRFGTIYPAFDDRDQRGLEARYEWQRAAGVSVFPLTLKETRRIEPNLTPRIQMALYYPEDHQVDNRNVVDALIVSVQRSGVEIRQGVEALRLRHANGRVTGVDIPGAFLEAPLVINASGSWARYLAGVPGACCPPVRPIRGQMVALTVADAPPFRHTIYSGKAYLVPRSNGRLLVGATVEEAGFKKQVTVAGVMRLLKGAVEVAPVLRDFPVESTWAGFRPGTPDGWPILGPTSLKGFYLATGHFRNGILMAPLTGEWLTEAILSGVTPPPMRPFLIDRYLSAKVE